MPEAYKERRREEEEETEERKDKKRMTREKLFERKREYHAPETKIETAPKVEVKKPDEERKPTVEAAIKTTIEEKDIVIDDKGTLSKDYSAKDTLKFQRTDTFEHDRKKEEQRQLEEAGEGEKRRQVEVKAKSAEQLMREEMWEKVREEERKETIRKDIEHITKEQQKVQTAKEAQKEKIVVSRKEKVEEQKKAVEEHMHRQRREAEERNREVQQLRENLGRKKKSVSKEIETLQKILLGGAFSGRRKGTLGKFVKSLDDFVRSLSAKRQK